MNDYGARVMERRRAECGNGDMRACNEVAAYESRLAARSNSGDGGYRAILEARCAGTWGKKGPLQKDTAEEQAQACAELEDLKAQGAMREERARREAARSAHEMELSALRAAEKAAKEVVIGGVAVPKTYLWIGAAIAVFLLWRRE